MPYRGVFAQFFSYLDAVATVSGEHVQNTCGNACAHRKLCRCECREGRKFGRLNHHWTASSQCRCHLACNHRQGEIPRGDGRAHTYRLLDDHDSTVVVEGREGLAIDAFGLLREPLNEARGVRHLAFRFWQWFPLFGRHDAPQVLLVGHEQVKPLSQDLAAFLAALGAPCGPCRVCCCNRCRSRIATQVGDVGELLARGGVADIELGRAVHPLAIDKRRGLE